ncbi:MAG: C69 family dipeptidase [Solobacterium sp.]|nr:C69 family dipeptidase [Solobacterium sp.]
MTGKENLLRSSCSTLIAGKNASFNGHVLLGHGEDTSGVRTQSHLVPRKTHAAGETVTFADGTAVIPQVPVTYAYLWNEIRVPGGECFADTFLNENGVAVVSNNGLGSKKAETGSDGAIGYGMRKLIAERAKSARHGVEVAAELMKDFGYYSSRIYHIADKDEAWSVQLTTGHQFAARRVGDDEIYYLPNWYTIHEIDFSDTEHKNFYWSDDLVGFAMRNGWYTPAVEGDYSDFDFAKAYQGGPAWYTPINRDRHVLGWVKTIGREVPEFTFAVKAEKKYTVQDFKDILRVRWLDDHPEDADQTYEPVNGVNLEMHRGINWHGSIEGSVFEFSDDPMLNCMWRTIDRQRHSIFMPWYFGMKEIPSGFEYLGEVASTASHFFVDEAEISRFDRNYAFWSFHVLRDLMDFEFEEEKLLTAVRKLENYFAASKAQTDRAYQAMKAEDEDQARELLTDYTAAMALKTVRFIEQMIYELVQDKYEEKQLYNF